MTTKLKRLEVTWTDCCGPPDVWRDFDEAKEIRPVRIMSCGYLIHETAEAVTLAASCGTNGQVGGLVCIPKTAILKRKLR